MRRQKIIWSPIEIEYLQAHQHDPVNQLALRLAKSFSAVKNKLRELNGKLPVTKKPNQRHSKIGRRKDCGNQFFRSSWEANFFRYLKTLDNVTHIEYEPTTFTYWQFGHNQGTVSYTPDFKVTYQDGSYHWVEIKGGFMKPSDKTKIRRLKKYYPEEFKKLIAVTSGPNTKTAIFFKEMDVEITWFYPDLNKQYKNSIPHWE